MRKRLLIGLLSAGLVGAMLPGIVGADGAIVDQNPGSKAGPGCVVFGHGIQGVGPLAADHATEVWSRGGVVSFVCQGRLPGGVSVEPGHSTSGFPCTVKLEPKSPTISTLDTFFKANKAGNWTFRCLFSDVELPT